jgi:hypothetical protein
MAITISRSEAIELLNSTSETPVIVTSHLRLVETSHGEYKVLNRQGRLICILQVLMKEKLGEYVFTCSCISGRAGMLCHHTLAALQKLNIMN